VTFVGKQSPKATINYDHTVARETIHDNIVKLKKAFRGELCSALASMTDIGGNHFIINLANKHYDD